MKKQAYVVTGPVCETKEQAEKILKKIPLKTRKEFTVGEVTLTVKSVTFDKEVK